MADLVKTLPLEEVATKGAAIYAARKSNFEQSSLGKFLAIEVEAEKIYEGANSAEALEKARAENPGKLFYVVKVGSDSAETLSNLFLKKK